MRRLVLALGGLATAFFLLYGCYFLVDWLAIEHKTATERFDAVPTVGLDVEGEGGIRIIGDGGDGIRVDFNWREGLQRPTLETRREGGRLVVRTRCPEVVEIFCEVETTVHVPTGTAVEGGGSSLIEVVDVAGPVAVSVDNGSVRVEGARGRVRVDGDNGSVTVADSIGPLVLRTDNGSVRTERVEAPTVDAETDSGQIELDLIKAPSSVLARASNGSVTVLVPDDGRPYATTVAADNGSVDDPIQTSPDAGRSIEARTDNGNVSVRYRD